MSARFEHVASLAELSDGIPHAAALSDGTEVCLIRVGNEVFAVHNRCTHAEFALSDSDMVDDYVIECGLHGAQFDIRTGEVLDLPATEPLPCFQVRVEDGEVWVRAAAANQD